jgi:hypothetical protein
MRIREVGSGSLVAGHVSDFIGNKKTSHPSQDHPLGRLTRLGLGGFDLLDWSGCNEESIHRGWMCRVGARFPWHKSNSILWSNTSELCLSMFSSFSIWSAFVAILCVGSEGSKSSPEAGKLGLVFRMRHSDFWGGVRVNEGRSIELFACGEQRGSGIILVDRDGPHLLWHKILENNAAPWS